MLMVFYSQITLLTSITTFLYSPLSQLETAKMAPNRLPPNVVSRHDEVKLNAQSNVTRMLLGDKRNKIK